METNTIRDIFDAKIMCPTCDTVMQKGSVERNGFCLRAISCPECTYLIVHPKDEEEYKHFKDLKKKQFQVKMRFVGNSYAVSIPREIVEFMRAQEHIFDDMVRLHFEEFGRISLRFAPHDRKIDKRSRIDM